MTLAVCESNSQYGRQQSPVLQIQEHSISYPNKNSPNSELNNSKELESEICSMKEGGMWVSNQVGFFLILKNNIPFEDLF